MTVREQGSSNKVFYYTLSGPYTTFNMRMEITLAREVQAALWARCVDKVLKVFPEFAVRPVIMNNRVCSEENHAPAPVFTEARVCALGTDDTNGYLFCHIVEGCRIRVSFFHGLCDAIGMECFLDCALYIYAKKTGLLKAEDAVPAIYESRFGAERPASLMELPEEALDPYGHLVKTCALASDRKTLERDDYYFAPRQRELVQSDSVHVYSVHTGTGAFLGLSKAMGVSFTALLIPLIARAISKGCQAQEETMCVMLPVNLRQIYGVKTLVNFSDGIKFFLDGDLRRQPLAMQAAACMKRLKAGMTRDYFDASIMGTVRAVKAFEAGDTPAERVEPRPFVTLSEGRRPPYTCALTYPRRMQDFSFLNDVNYGFVVSTSVAVVVYTWRDHMAIRFVQKSDSDAIAKAMAACLEAEGLRAEVRDEGLVEGDVLLMSRLKKREEG